MSPLIRAGLWVAVTLYSVFLGPISTMLHGEELDWWFWVSGFLSAVAFASTTQELLGKIVAARRTRAAVDPSGSAAGR